MTTVSRTRPDNGASASRRRDPSRRSARADLDRLERLFADLEWSDRRAFQLARRSARARAMEILAEHTRDSEHTALLIASASLFGGLRADLAKFPARAADLAQQIEEHLGVSQFDLAREVLRSPELLALPPIAAADAELAMLMAFAPLRSASLWSFDDAERLYCVRYAGEGAPSRGAKRLAQQMLTGEPERPAPRQLLLALPIGRWPKPIAALIGSARPGGRDRCHSLLLECAPMLGAIMERETLVASNAATERTLVESSERKLTRLGFDLHDGPIQDVAVAAEDLRGLRDMLERMLDEPNQGKLVRRHIGELEGQLVTLDVGLRRISNEVRAASILLNRPFARAVRDQARAFAARTNVEPRVELDGDMDLLSGSQQIALLNIIHEALSNVREHSNATKVEILVNARPDGIEARIVDNGDGFDLEHTLSRTAREGRLGLVAMHERVRLLGGQCSIDSRPGGPTVISVAFELWEPLSGDP